MEAAIVMKPPRTRRPLTVENNTPIDARLKQAGELGLKLSAQVEKLTAERDAALSTVEEQRREHTAAMSALWRRVV